jgi:glycosyltransferase involved in cell wall biosynthesis
LFGIWSVLRSVDAGTVLYLNSFFARRYSMLAAFMRWMKLCRPRTLVLAPRGEFSLGALQFKSCQKRLYVQLAERLGLYSGIIWHASSALEEEDIRRVFPRTHWGSLAGVFADGRGSAIAAATDVAGRYTVAASSRAAKEPGHLRAVFVSRISPKKNVAGAVRMLHGLKGDVSLDIYGPKEDFLVRYCGEIKHSLVPSVFFEHELFLFPTFGENYGHVIGEALAAGCPVLISDQTPWRDLQAAGIGWDLPLADTEGFRLALQQCIDGDNEWFTSISARAMFYAAQRASDPKVIEDNRRLFQAASGLVLASSTVSEASSAF